MAVPENQVADLMFQLNVWNYAVCGDRDNIDVVVAESRCYDELDRGVGWDRKRVELDTMRLSDPVRGERGVPDWWGLQHLPLSWREEAVRSLFG